MLCGLYLKHLVLPFSLRQEIREELSLAALAEILQAWHLTLAGDRAFVQVLSERQELMS